MSEKDQAELASLCARLKDVQSALGNEYQESVGPGITEGAQIHRLRTENEKLKTELATAIKNWEKCIVELTSRDILVAALRRDLADPSSDVQELVIKRLDLISRDALKAEAERVTARDVQIITAHEDHGEFFHCLREGCLESAKEEIRAAQAKEREG